MYCSLSTSSGPAVSEEGGLVYILKGGSQTLAGCSCDPVRSDSHRGRQVCFLAVQTITNAIYLGTQAPR